MKKKFCIKR